MKLTRRCYFGSEISEVLPSLSRLRIAVFREFPYLYDGDLKYEMNYFKTYLREPRSLLIAVFDGQKMIGASTALPLVAAGEEYAKAYGQHQLDPEKIFYFAESVVLPGYRGQGLGQEFFNLRLNHARSLGGFKFASFCAVIRESSDPRRPSDYHSPESLWLRQGFKKLTGPGLWLSWKAIDEMDESPKELAIWIKSI